MKIIISLILILFIGVSCSQQKDERITKLSQLKDKRISILTGTAGDIVSRKRFPDAKLIDFYATTDAAYNVKIGKSEAFVFDEVVLKNIAGKYPGLTLIDESVASADIAVAFPHERIVLLEKVNDAIQQMRKKGTLQAMKQKWIDSEYEKVPDLPDWEFEFTEEDTSVWVRNGFYYNKAPEMRADSVENVLKVGINAQFEPMMFVSNNKFTGFDMELALRIGKMLNRKIEFVDGSFDSLILSLQADKIDFAISNFEITEPRKEFMSFSDPYLVQDISALVKK